MGLLVDWSTGIANTTYMKTLNPDGFLIHPGGYRNLYCYKKSAVSSKPEDQRARKPVIFIKKAKIFA